MKRIWGVKRRWILSGGIALLLIFIACQFRPSPPPPDLPSGYSADKAAWLGITWSMDVHSDAEIAALAQNLQTHGITYAFVYVSYLKPGDFFNPTFDHASAFTERLRAAAPEITLLAWIGVPVQVTMSDGETIENRLVDPEIRNLIAEFAAQTVTEFGFDGPHLNAELVHDNDPAFLATLDAIRDALPPETFLSTTAHHLRLTEQITIVPYPTLQHAWSVDYLHLVAERSDQVALMAYDSALFFPTDYRSWMAYQVRQSANVLAETDTHFLIGVPVSEEWTISHHVPVETLENALYGLRVGLAEGDAPDVIDGIAIYPYWEISADEWDSLDAFP